MRYSVIPRSCPKEDCTLLSSEFVSFLKTKVETTALSIKHTADMYWGNGTIYLLVEALGKAVDYMRPVAIYDAHCRRGVLQRTCGQ